MNDILDKLVGKIREDIAGNDDLALTIIGKAGSGNVRVKVHYKRDNLVAAIVYRHDLHQKELQSPEFIDQYMMVLPVDKTPWTEVPVKGLMALTTIPAIVQRKVESTLPESMAMSDTILGVLEDCARQATFIRQWRANNGGTGVEIIFIHRDEEGKRHVFELVVNYYQYIKPETVVERLKTAAQ